MDINRNLEAELTVVGSILRDPTVTRNVSLVVTAEDFTSSRYAALYAAALAAEEKGLCFGIASACEVLKPLMPYNDIEEFICQCLLMTPTAIHAVPNAECVHKHAQKRRLIDEVMKSLDYGTDALETAGDIITTCQSLLQGEKSPRLQTLSDALMGMYTSKTKTIRRVDTGFARLDGLLKGLCGGNLVVLGARTGVGKSAFAIGEIARHAAASGRKTLVFSLEMLAEELAERLVARDERLDMDRLIENTLTQEDWQHLSHVSAAVSTLPLLICDDPLVTVSRIRSHAFAIPDLQLIVVDFVTLMQSSQRYENRNLEVGAISRELKNLAAELKIPILLLAQLNREKDETQEPELRDLRDSGELEQNANKVLLLWNLDRPVKSDKTNKTELPRVALKIAKNRRGQKGTVIFRFDGKHMRFKETSEEYQRGGGGCTRVYEG